MKYATVHHPRDELSEVDASRIVESLDLAYWAAELESLPSSSESDDERCHTSEVIVVSDVRPNNMTWESSDAIISKNKPSRMSHQYVRRFDTHCDVFVHSPREKSHKESSYQSTNTSSVSSDDNNELSTMGQRVQLSASDGDNINCMTRNIDQLDNSFARCTIANKDIYNSTQNEDIRDDDRCDENTVDTTIESVDTPGNSVCTPVDNAVESADGRVETHLTASVNCLRDHAVVLHADLETTWL